MDLLDDDLLQFWKMLQKHYVRYIMVGGFATRFHGFNRNTDDVDMWLYDSLENRDNLRKALLELGYGDMPSLLTMQFVAGWTSFYIGSGVELDIMTSMKGLEEYSFDDCSALASIAEIDGIKIPFLHINHLIQNKKTVNRPKDQIDVIELGKIKKIRDNKEKKM